VFGPDLNGRFGSLQGTGGLEAVILDADGTTTGVINDQFGNGVATVSGGTVTWNTTRVGAYGPLPGIQTAPTTDVSQLAAATAWRSHRIDPTGFYWLGARYYEPTSGRFLSADPMGHPASPSLYDYANGDPVNAFDPDGRCAQQGDKPSNGLFTAYQSDLYRDVSTVDAFNEQGSSAFETGKWSTTKKTVFSPDDIADAMEILGNTAGDFYTSWISSTSVYGFSGLTVMKDGSPVTYYSGVSGVSQNISGIPTIYVNLNDNDGWGAFGGTKAQFLAAVIYHEALHQWLHTSASDGGPILNEMSQGQEETIVRATVEAWAIANHIPETVPDGRSGSGFFGNKSPFSVNLPGILNGVKSDPNTYPFGSSGGSAAGSTGAAGGSSSGTSGSSGNQGIIRNKIPVPFPD
jgi:RHS repeat-associated protein